MRKESLLAAILGGLLAVAMQGCGSDVSHDTSQANAAPASVASCVVPSVGTAEEQTISAVVAQENLFREQTALPPLTAGLACTLYSSTGGTRIQSTSGSNATLTGLVAVSTFLYKGTFNQPVTSINDGLNVLPDTLKGQYKNNYLLRCTGQIVVTTGGNYTFDLTSDDGANLYIDGSLLDDDNAHGPTEVLYTKALRVGVHTFRLDYSQTGAGSEALILNVNGQNVNPLYLVH